MPASARRSGPRDDRRADGARRRPPDADVRALSRALRARRGRAAVGRRGQRVPRLPRRHLGLERRPLPPEGGRGDPRAGRRAPARRQPVLHRAMVRLAQRLATGSLGGTVFFTNSGAEAVEAALKLARKAKSGGDIVVLHRGFHGRTYGALSATPQESKQAPFAPLVPGFVPVEPTAEAVSAAVNERTAAVLLEPVQGESGVWPLPDDLLHAARAACDAHGAALLYDEIQCGLGRCGTLWAFQQSGVVPDAMTTAKALGGGLPIGAIVTGERLAQTLQPGDHGSTFAGGPVVTAAANAA